MRSAAARALLARRQCPEAWRWAPGAQTWKCSGAWAAPWAAAGAPWAQVQALLRGARAAYRGLVRVRAWRVGPWWTGREVPGLGAPGCRPHPCPCPCPGLSLRPAAVGGPAAGSPRPLAAVAAAAAGAPISRHPSCRHHPHRLAARMDRDPAGLVAGCCRAGCRPGCHDPCCQRAAWVQGPTRPCHPACCPCPCGPVQAPCPYPCCRCRTSRVAGTGL
mmetsp:Transcript_30224/g.77044  ORF Transcript_30224/g.77044 Transcript_30224/m.77044 type:complete len:218 (-) Transcript_30224:296-949(-)